MINNIMITSERRQELEFYIRNKYPIIFSGGREDPKNRFYGYTDDVYTLVELVEEGFLLVKNYDYDGKKVIVCTDEPITLFNGVVEVYVDQDSSLQLSLDDFTNRDFAATFYQNILNHTSQ